MRSFALVFLAAAACSPYSPDLGNSPFFCNGSGAPLCPDGYSCQSPQGGSGSGSDGLCIKTGGMLPVDANPIGNCADDSALEPNDTKDTAWATPVDTSKKTFPLTNLAICPMGDKDNYSIVVSTTGENIEVLVEFDTAGAALQGAILNTSGTAVANAMMVQGSPGHLRAYLANAPVGVYYAQVFGPADGSVTTNNYNMTINITGP
jgi:hypothetical protein